MKLKEDLVVESDEGMVIPAGTYWRDYLEVQKDKLPLCPWLI
jgi:hypothetical protein